MRSLPRDVLSALLTTFGVWTCACIVAALIPAITVTAQGTIEAVAPWRVALYNMRESWAWLAGGTMAALCTARIMRSSWAFPKRILAHGLVAIATIGFAMLTTPRSSKGAALPTGVKVLPLGSTGAAGLLPPQGYSARSSATAPIVFTSGNVQMTGALPLRVGNRLSILGIYTAVLLVTALVETRRRRSAAMATAQAAHARSLQLETELAAARLDALRLQLQPHFLFNTLNMIAGLVDTDPLNAKGLISRLGGLLRETQRVTAETVPLTQELAWLEDYAELQQARFGDRLRIDISAAPNTLDARVPFLILQPLVENAIQHGVGGGGAEPQGNIEIEARAARDSVVLVVRDNGVGMPDVVGRQGLGLANVRDRLNTQYGQHASLSITRGERGGTEITIKIPQVH